MKEKAYKILIVDDIQANLKLLEMLLANEGYETITVSTGNDAIKIAREEQPDLILLDVMMPVMDGFEVCRQLKKYPGTTDIPVIFISAKVAIPEKIKGLKLGAVDFITKPFNQTEVITRIQIQLRLLELVRQLKQSEKRYQSLIENIQDGIFIWQKHKGITFVNSGFAEMLGYSSENIMSKNLSDILINEDDERKLKNIFSEIIENFGEKTKKSTEYIFKLSDKNSRTVHVGLVPAGIIWENDKAVLVTVRDISDRISLQEQLNQAQKLEAIGLLTSGITHDFNNILSLINGYTELAMYEVDKNSSVYEKLKIVLEAGKSAVSLTRGLLAFSKKKNMQLEYTDIVNEIRLIYDFLHRSLPETIEFTLETPDKEISTLIDKGQLQQIIVNLCLNARDAMPQGGKLKISLSEIAVSEVPPYAPPEAEPGQYILISVTDTGKGIPEELRSQIFTPFFTTKARGSGLGLAMVERVIRNHSGWITFESKINRGTTFTIFLPVRKLHETQKGLGSKYTHVTHTEFNKVLVVDDDEVLASLMEYFLRLENYDVSSVNTPGAVLDILEKEAAVYNLLIIDYLMPKMTGQELTKIVRNKWPHINILWITGAMETPVTKEMILRKPFTARDLLQKLDELYTKIKR